MYRHTQAGYAVRLSALIPAGIVVTILWPSARDPAPPVLVPLLLVGAVLIFLLLVSTLTIAVDASHVRWWFGPGLFERQLALADIVDARVVRNPWWAGWGVRWVPDGWLYNISGLDAVAVRTCNGRTVRLGTDEPARLLDALRRALPGAGSKVESSRNC